MEKIDKIVKNKYHLINKQEVYLKELSQIFNTFVQKFFPSIPIGYVSVAYFSDKEGSVGINVKDPLILNKLSAQKEYIKYEFYCFDNKVKDVVFILN